MTSDFENTVGAIALVMALFAAFCLPHALLIWFLCVLAVALVATTTIGWLRWREKATNYFGELAFAKAGQESASVKVRRLTSENARLRRQMGEPVEPADPALVVVWPAGDLLPNQWARLERALGFGLPQEIYDDVFAAAHEIKADTYHQLRAHLMEDGLVIDVAREAAVRVYAGGEERYAALEPTRRLLMNVQMQAALLTGLAAALPETNTVIAVPEGASDV